VSHPHFFEQVRDALVAVIDEQYADFGGSWHGYGLKVVFGTGDRAKEHYETQLVRGRRAGIPALEIGFHAEHARAERNDAVLATLTAREATWRRRLGKQPVAGPFLGNDRWRRVSETWDEFDLEDPECAIEVAARLQLYVAVLEPLLRR
jgi:hypothetical protein